MKGMVSVKINNVAIVGMGALGMMYGQLIQRGLPEADVRFVMDGGRLARHKNDVYKVNGEIQRFTLEDAAAAGPADLVIVATKYGGLDGAISEMQGLIGSGTVIISVLNGITSEEKLMARFGRDNVLHCVVLGMDAVRAGTKLTYQHTGLIKIGMVNEKQRPALDAVTDFFDRAGLAYRVEEDILHALWAKLLLNVGINQTCMVYETDYGGALADDEARASMYAAMHEVIAVAQAEGVSLTEEDFGECVRVLRGLNGSGLPSMRQDALAKRPSEVELFAGTIIKLARRHNIPAPVNERYYRRIKEIEAGY